MHLVTTHTNTDFDALASMVAASFLDPDSVRMVPSQVQPAVREFLAVHWDLLRLQTRRGLDPAAVRRLTVTDTSSWDRLDDLRALAERPDLEIAVWDHHPGPGTIAAGEEHRVELGATVTLLLERLEAEDRAISPVHATLFLLGIHDDTGRLSFPSTTARDVRMAAFLLDCGADLNVVAAYLEGALDDRHREVFQRMLTGSETFDLGGVRFGLCLQDADKGLSLLSRVVGKFQEISGLDVAFGIFPLAAAKTAVIGRGNPRLFDIGAALRQLGGGGHPGAGSAMVKAPADAVLQRLTGLIHETDRDAVAVRDLMSEVGVALAPQDRLGEAAARLRRHRRSALLVMEEGRALGTLGEDQLARIRDQAAWEHPVASLMLHEVSGIHPDRTQREALRLMSQSGVGVLPVIDDGRVVGEITRAAILLSLYDF